MTRTTSLSCFVQIIESPVGPLVAAAVPDGLCLLEFSVPDRLHTQMQGIRRWFGCEAAEGDSPHLALVREELRAYFAGALTQFTVPVVTPGTPFQQRVWSELQRIPYGQTRSYEEIAHAVGRGSAPRAVGQANGMNRIAIVIPCHRVVNKDGKLGGYGGELWRKDVLLRLEGARLPLFS
jgi:AraC family transcriptional regulator of adaptative response/methylated-DNA-[protein]-cysteine methyltransferase